MQIPISKSPILKAAMDSYQSQEVTAATSPKNAQSNETAVSNARREKPWHLKFLEAEELGYCTFGRSDEQYATFYDDMTDDYSPYFSLSEFSKYDPSSDSNKPKPLENASEARSCEIGKFLRACGIEAEDPGYRLNSKTTQKHPFADMPMPIAGFPSLPHLEDEFFRFGQKIVPKKVIALPIKENPEVDEGPNWHSSSLLDEEVKSPTIIFPALGLNKNNRPLNIKASPSSSKLNSTSKAKGKSVEDIDMVANKEVLIRDKKSKNKARTKWAPLKSEERKITSNIPPG